MLLLRKLLWRRELRDVRRQAGMQGKVLEIGCATGEYLEALRDLGMHNLTGIEYNPKACDIARQRYNLDVWEGDLQSAHLPENSFDAVVMRHALEHVASPTQTLRELHRILKPGAKFFFSIPSPDGLDAKIFKQFWHGYEIPRHFFGFPLKTLHNMLAALGFEQEKVEFSFVPNDWIISLKYLLESIGVSQKISGLFDISNPFALAAFLPIGILAGLFRCSGRIRVTARKRD